MSDFVFTLMTESYDKVTKAKYFAFSDLRYYINSNYKVLWSDKRFGSKPDFLSDCIEKPVRTLALPSEFFSSNTNCLDFKNDIFEYLRVFRYLKGDCNTFKLLAKIDCLRDWEVFLKQVVDSVLSFFEVTFEVLNLVDPRLSISFFVRKFFFNLVDDWVYFIFEVFPLQNAKFDGLEV